MTDNIINIIHKTIVNTFCNNRQYAACMPASRIFRELLELNNIKNTVLYEGFLNMNIEGKIFSVYHNWIEINNKIYDIGTDISKRQFAECNNIKFSLHKENFTSKDDIANTIINKGYNMHEEDDYWKCHTYYSMNDDDYFKQAPPIILKIRKNIKKKIMTNK